MQHTRPLQDHPEFTIREYQGCTEYRVENWCIARDGSRRVLKNYGWSWVDPVIPLLAAAFWQTVRMSLLYLYNELNVATRLLVKGYILCYTPCL